MFTKFSTLFVAGAMVMAAGNANSADDFGQTWGSRPSYAANGTRSLNNGIAVGGCYPANHSGYHWSSSGSGSGWSNNRWDRRPIGYGSSLPDRAPPYLPAYRPSTYNNAFNHNLPAYRHTSWDTGHGFYR